MFSKMDELDLLFGKKSLEAWQKHERVTVLICTISIN